MKDKMAGMAGMGKKKEMKDKEEMKGKVKGMASAIAQKKMSKTGNPGESKMKGGMPSKSMSAPKMGGSSMKKPKM